jgi:hypothetical protein
LEKVQEPSCSEDSIDQRPALAFAELIAPDMRMYGLSRLPGGIWFQGVHFVGTSIADSVPMQANLEWPQVNLFQNDRLSFDRKGLIRCVDAYALEFVRKCDEVVEDFAGCLRWQVPAGARDLAGDLVKSLRAVLDGTF